MRIKNFEEADKLLKAYRPTANIKYTLDRMITLMDKLGNPQDSYKVINIAGTSGKTSTSYYVAALLGQTGSKVGLTVSPHVDRVNERIQINLIPLEESIFCSKLSEFIALLLRMDIKPSYFELLIAFAYWEFARQKVDYAVVEVGLGGLLDCTNVVKRSDKVSVITDIGLDHTNVLGDDIVGIAAQKAGIILPRSVAFSHHQPEAIMQVFRAVAKEKEARLYEIDERRSELTKDLPSFQKRNWDLADQVTDYVIRRDGLDALTKTQKANAAYTYIPARMEIVDFSGKKIIIDGSHNQQKLEALANAVNERFPNTKIAVVVGLLEEKDTYLHEALKGVIKIADFIIATSFFAGQDIPKKPMAAQHMAKLFIELGFSDVVAISDPEKAFKVLMKRNESVVLVTGSFYLLNHIRPLVFNKAANKKT